MKYNIRDRRNGSWYWISRIVYEKYSSKIGAIGLALYNAYASYSFNEQEVYPSQKTIAKKLNITKPTLIKYNAVLVKYKLISIIKTTGEVNVISLLKIQEKETASKNRPVKEVYHPSKGGLPPPVKEVYPNKNKYKKNKRKTVANKFDNVLFSLKDMNDKKTFNVICTNKLYKALHKKRKMQRIPNIQTWNRQFKNLYTKSNPTITKAQVKKVLNWYCKHIGEKYLTKAYSAKTFCDSFIKIEDSMNCNIKNTEEDDFEVTTSKKGKYTTHTIHYDN